MSNSSFIEDYFTSKRSKLESPTNKQDNLIQRIEYLESENKNLKDKLKKQEKNVNVSLNHKNFTAKPTKIDSPNAEDTIIQRLEYLETKNKDLEKQVKQQSNDIDKLRKANSRNEVLIHKLLLGVNTDGGKIESSKNFDKPLTILDLPFSVTKRIFSYVSEKDLFWNVGFTCTAMQNCAFESVRVITIEMNTSAAEFEKTLNYVLTFENIAKNIQYILAATEDKSGANLMQEVKEKCRHSDGKILLLKHLKEVNSDTSLLNDNTLFIIWKNCPQLKKIVAWGQTFFLLGQ